MKKLFLLAFTLVIANFMFAQNVEVTFNVDMNIAVSKGTFDAANRDVAVAGNFTNWGDGVVLTLSDDDNDLIYTGSLDTFAVNDTLFFKFVTVDPANGTIDAWENDPNREYVVTGTDDSYSDLWNRDSVVATDPVALTFACDMTYEIVSGRFDQNTDTLTVRGSFNGWGGDDILTPSIANPFVYELTYSANVTEGEEWNYKYAYITGNGVNWEGDPNKVYTFTADDIAAGEAYALRTFNDLTPASVTNNPVEITFQVNMDGAVSSVNGNPFTEIANVIVTGAMPPMVWPGAGWPDKDSAGIFYLNDSGEEGDETAGDNIWSTTVTFPQFSPLRVQYKYGANWGLESNTGSNDNESSIGTDHFFEMYPYMTSGKVLNEWSVMGDTVLYALTDVQKDENAVVTSYALEQNYPNPFNPSTSINFSIPEAGLVTLKVYNVLGQEVATLVNDVMNTGAYNVSFNAANLSTGTYIYRISVNNYTMTKKMMLVK